MLGVFASLVFWPRKWSSDNQKRIAILLTALFLVLLAAHFYAAITLNYNVFAFTVYLSFFDILGLFLVVSTYRNWNLNTGILVQVLVCVVLIVIVVGIAYSASEVGSPYGLAIRAFLDRRALTFEGGKIMTARWKWWEVLKGRLGWEYATSVKSLGMILFLSFVTIFNICLTNILRGINKNNHKPFVSYLLIGFLGLGILGSPTVFLGGSRDNYDCQLGVIDTYSQAVNEISNYIEDGEQVFWIGSDTEVVLIGLTEEKDIGIFPQLLNTRYSFRFGGSSDQLAMRGFWNEELAQEWIDQSDTLLLEEQAFTGWFDPILPLVNLDEFTQVGTTSLTGCSPDERILIYQKDQ
jgi:hypothetical protein